MHEFFYRVFLAFINPLYPLFMLYGIDEWIDQRSVGVIGAYSQSSSEASSSRGWTVQSSCSNVARISDDMALPDSAVLILILRRGEGRAEDARRLLSVWLIQRLKGRALTVKNMFCSDQYGPEKHLTKQRVISLKVRQGLVNGASWGRTFKHCGFAWSMGRWFYWVNAIDTPRKMDKTFYEQRALVPLIAQLLAWQAVAAEIVFSMRGAIRAQRFLSWTML